MRGPTPLGVERCQREPVVRNAAGGCEHMGHSARCTHEDDPTTRTQARRSEGQVRSAVRIEVSGESELGGMSEEHAELEGVLRTNPPIARREEVRASDLVSAPMRDDGDQGRGPGYETLERNENLAFRWPEGPLLVQIFPEGVEARGLVGRVGSRARTRKNATLDTVVEHLHLLAQPAPRTTRDRSGELLPPGVDVQRAGVSPAEVAPRRSHDDQSGTPRSTVRGAGNRHPEEVFRPVAVDGVDERDVVGARRSCDAERERGRRPKSSRSRRPHVTPLARAEPRASPAGAVGRAFPRSRASSAARRTASRSSGPAWASTISTTPGEGPTTA